MTRTDIDTIGSPIFHITIANIADGAFEAHNLDQHNSQYAKYIPFDWIELTNASALDLELVLNDVHTFRLSGNVTTVKSDIPFNRFRIVNNSGALLTGTDLYVSVQHTPLTEDKVIRKPKGLIDNIRENIGLLGLMR